MNGEESATPPELVCRVASSQAERQAAFSLVYRAYLQAGLIEPNPYEMRVTAYHLLPVTDIFLAWEGDRPIGTLSLVKDGAAGLPCAALFPVEAKRRRRQGRRLGEASSLALADTRLPHKAVLFGLMRLLAQAARRAGLDEIIATVHPRHAPFYERVFGFEAFGSMALHPQLRHRPALGLSLSLARIERLRPPAYGLFFGSELAFPLLASSPISQAEQEFFRRAAAESDRCCRLAFADGNVVRPAA